MNGKEKTSRGKRQWLRWHVDPTALISFAEVREQGRERVSER